MKICPNCDKMYEDSQFFCGNCGSPLKSIAKPKKRNYFEIIKESIPSEDTWRDMYLTFNGRLTEGEFASRLFILAVAFTIVLSICAILPVVSLFSSICMLALSVMHLSLVVRRLHDLNDAGVWGVLNFIPIINIALNVYLLFRKSGIQDNKYGKSKVLLE